MDGLAEALKKFPRSVPGTATVKVERIDHPMVRGYAFAHSYLSVTAEWVEQVPLDV